MHCDINDDNHSVQILPNFSVNNNSLHAVALLDVGMQG